MREEFSILMRRFYAHVLLPAYGIEGILPREIKITFPEIQNADAKSIAEAVEIAAKTGVFKDWREIRKIFNTNYYLNSGFISISRSPLLCYSRY